VKKSPKERSNSTKEFSRFAHSYGQYNMIQARVVQELIAMLPEKRLGTVLDIGCGSGAVYQTIREVGIAYERFVALDASEAMLQRHPDGSDIEIVLMDFNTPSSLHLPPKTLILSSSALQWSRDLDRTLCWLSSLGAAAYFAIFTSGTFRTLHQTAGVDSPIHSLEDLKATLDRYFDASYHIRDYALEFGSVRDMFRYIKKSGVSGGEKQLGYRETKLLMRNYPVNYLEFEVLFMKGVPKKA